MVNRAADMPDARDAILQAVPHLGNPAPMRLIEYLMEQGCAEDVVRTALWYLIDEKELVLTHDWLIRRLAPNGSGR